MELPVMNSHSEFGVFAPNTEDSAYPRMMLSERELKYGVTSSFVRIVQTTFKSE